MTSDPDFYAYFPKSQLLVNRDGPGRAIVLMNTPSPPATRPTKDAEYLQIDPNRKMIHFVDWESMRGLAAV